MSLLQQNYLWRRGFTMITINPKNDIHHKAGGTLKIFLNLILGGVCFQNLLVMH